MSTPGDGAPLLIAGLAGRCPRCGKGPLFDGYIKIAPACTTCGLSFAGNDTGDGPAFFIMLPLCLIVAGLALGLELTLAPPIWVHMVLWVPFIALFVLLTLRPVKALMVALQYRYRDVEHDSQGGEGQS
jgi:uncharacterized protein (DUF983 family)